MDSDKIREELARIGKWLENPTDEVPWPLRLVRKNQRREELRGFAKNVQGVDRARDT